MRARGVPRALGVETTGGTDETTARAPKAGGTIPSRRLSANIRLHTQDLHQRAQLQHV
jgi:hypothetical protein